MLPRADFVIYDRDGHPSVAVEVKRKLGTTRRWAAEFHRNLLAHGNGGAVDYYTIVTPDRLYVWDENEETGPMPDPTFEIPAEPAFEPYFSRTGLKPESVSGDTFEWIVEIWLNDLVDPFPGRAGERDPADVAGLSRIINRIRGGRVEPEADA